MVIIREADIKDFDSYIKLYNSLTEYHIQNRPDILKSVPRLTKSDFKKIIKNKDIFITVIEKDKEIIGFSKWQIKKVRNNPHLQKRVIAFVDEFFVDFPFRRNGYGKKLWNKIVDIASKRGAQHIELYVWEFNENAQKFYERHGMTPQRTVYGVKNIMDIQITPTPISGSIEGIASKSFAHRALICACLAKGKSRIKINTSSADIEATLECLRNLGAEIEKNGVTYTVTPIGALPEKAKIDCVESGSTIRFLLPVICALGINTEIHGSGRLPERPLSPLKEELIRMGAEISDAFPLNVSGKISAGEYTLRGDVSSQFVTGLLMALSYLGGGKIKLLPPVQSRPYIDITLQVLRTFGADINEENNTFYINQSPLAGCDFAVEADWSNAAFPLCMGAEVTGLNPGSTQGDKAIIDVLKRMGASVTETGGSYKADLSSLHGCRIDASDIPDAVPVIAAIAATAEGETVIFNGGRLRIKESDRIQTTVSMIKSLGGNITETDDGMVINGKPFLTGGETESFNDHRIAMAAAVASLKCRGSVIIRNAGAVNKSYPAFFEDFNKLGGKARVM